jgi:hypothetical protein
MKFFDKQMTHKQLRATILAVSKKLGVNKVNFNKTGKYLRGTYECVNRNMYLNLRQTKKEILVSFFHELGHHMSIKNNRWLKYHHSGLQAIDPHKIFYMENKIDKIASKLWRKYVCNKAWGNYKFVYPKTQKRMFVKLFS